MRKLTLLCASLCALTFVVLDGPTHAQSILWVGPNGSDDNNCSQALPCATFAGAIQKGGVAQISCLGSGNYGTLNSTTVSITDTIVIDCGVGNIGVMTTGGGSAVININSSDPNALIVLRHLSLNGGENNAAGINAQSFAGGTLIVEDCMIHGLRGPGNTPQGVGIYFAPTGGRGSLKVSDTRLYDNANGGIEVNPSSGQIASVTLNRDEITSGVGSGAEGILFQGAGTVAGTMRQTVVAENGGVGIFGAGGPTYFTIEESSIVDNLLTGIVAGSTSTHFYVGASTITGNGTGVLAFPGAFLVSFGNNQLDGNGDNGSFTSTSPLQ